MSPSKRKESAANTDHESFGEVNHQSHKFPEGVATTKHEPLMSGGEDERAVKKLRVDKSSKHTKMQSSLNDYGTLASQRPRRTIRPPRRFQDSISLSPTKPQLQTKKPLATKTKSSQKSKPPKDIPQHTETNGNMTNKYGFPIGDQTEGMPGASEDEANEILNTNGDVDSEPKSRTPTPAASGGTASPDDHEASCEMEKQDVSQVRTLPTPEDSPESGLDPAPVSHETVQCPATENPHQADLPPTPESVLLSEAITEATECLESVDNALSLRQLRSLAKKLRKRSKILPKPQPAGSPEVWADGRQELCETLHYYRAYQGAGYSTGGFVRGFMFDKVAHPRDYMDSNVVIARAGGGQTKDKETGEMKAGRDQVEDIVAQNLRNCRSHLNPVVLLTGVDNPNMPSLPPHQYCVLDYFKPTHIWAEKQGKSKIVRYRFEKLNGQKESWWRPKHSTELVELGSLGPPLTQICASCKSSSIQVYLNGWMCLEPCCREFWKIHGAEGLEEPDEESLIYDPRFLKQKMPWPNEDHEYPLTSNNVELSGRSVPGEDTSEAFWLGIVCPECGRCNSRLSWMGWECENPACNYTKEPRHTLIPGLTMREPTWPITNSYTLSRDVQSPLIDVRVSFSHGYRINRYGIPGIDGFITHMIANKTVVEEAGGPDAMFEELQETDIGLRRRPMPNGQLKGSNHCRQFLVNYGMPYKFIAATASRSFDGAARPITATRSRLNWAAQLILAQEPTPDPSTSTSTSTSTPTSTLPWTQANEFNEVLALGYFESQKINYHDDGEVGLGPTIATLSLGAPGTMRIRMKARHYHGVSSAGIYDDAPPIPGCQNYAARDAVQADFAALKTSDTKAYNAARRTLPRQLKLSSKGNAKEVLTMQLGHGDVVVMHGAELQRYYEHSVEHAGKLRFALTCRYIDAGSLEEAHKPDYEVGVDEGVYDGAGLLV